MGDEQGTYVCTFDRNPPPLPTTLHHHNPNKPKQVELERAVACACKRVLRDPTQTLAALEARAQGLVVLGQAFSAVGRMGVGGGGGLR